MTTPSIVEKAKSTIKQIKLKGIPLMISTEEHQHELASMQEVVPYEKFFFVVDTVNQQIELVHGVKRWLGYDDEKFTMMDYFSKIHPTQMTFLIHLAKVSFEIATTVGFKMLFRQQRYIVDIALQHAGGHYVLCKRSLTPWQWQYNGSQQLLTHYFLEFTITNHHLSELNTDIAPRIYDRFGHKLADLEELFRIESSQTIEKKSKIFTTQELRILRKIAYNPNITSEEIANAFKIKKSTIHVFNKKLIEKGKEILLDDSIQNAKDLALRLRRNFWL